MSVDFTEFSRKMDKTLVHLAEEFDAVRAGRANPKVLDRITVSYYGHVETCVVRVVTKEEYLAMGYKIPSDEKGGCNASVTGVYGSLILISLLCGGVYVSKRRK